MTLEEAIEHSKRKSLELCGECAEEHRMLAIWLTDLRDLTKNGYGNFTNYFNKHVHEFTIASMQGRLSANPSLTPREMAKLVLEDVKVMMEELRLNYPYKNNI